MPARIRDVDAETVAKRYCAGEKVVTLADDYGVSENTILNRLREAGMTLKHGPERKYDDAEICQMYQDGMDVSEIQQKTGAKTVSTFYAILKRNNVSVRLQRHSRDDPVIRARILKMHAKGATQVAIAKAVGINRNYVRDILLQEVSVDRKVWQETPMVRRNMSIEEMRESGLTIDEIAEIKQISRLEVYQNLNL